MINKYHIYGERCSGTNLVNAIISGSSFYHNRQKPAFPELVLNTRFGHKHWIGHYTKRIIEDGNDTLFICIIRNPYDWITSFSRKLHHIPSELRNINCFLNNTWYSVSKNKEIIEDRFWKTGERFSNIFELREEKAKYLYYVIPRIAKHSIFIRYEDLCDNPSLFIDTIALKTGHEPQESDLKITKKTYPELRPIIKESVDSKSNWELENLLGYKKRFTPAS